MARAMRDALNDARILGKLQRDPAAFSREFARRVQELPEEGTFFLHTSWASRGNGHAIVLEVVRNAGDNYGIRIYNRGAGLEYHSTAFIEHKHMAMPFVELDHVELDGLTNGAFHAFLVGMTQPDRRRMSLGQSSFITASSRCFQGPFLW